MGRNFALNRFVAIRLGIALGVIAVVAAAMLSRGPGPGGDEVLLAAIPVQSELTRDLEVTFRLESIPPIREVSVRFPGGRGLYGKCEDREGYTGNRTAGYRTRTFLYCDWALNVLLNQDTVRLDKESVTADPLTFRFYPDFLRVGENRLLLKPNPSLMAESILVVDRVEVWGTRGQSPTPIPHSRALLRNASQATPTRTRSPGVTITYPTSIRNASQATPTPTPPAQAAPPVRLFPESPIDNDHREGGLGAPLQVILFFDFLDPPSRRFWTDALPRLREDYLNPGKVLLHYRHFPLDHLPPSRYPPYDYRSLLEHYNGSTPWALTAQCARDYGKFQEMADKIFGQLNWNARNFDPNRWNWVSVRGSVIMDENETLEWAKRWAGEMGLDTDTFNACLDRRKPLPDVEKDYRDGAAASIVSTPTLLVGSPARGYVKVEGTPPYPQFNVVVNKQVGETLPYSRLREVIEEELAAAGP